MNGRPCIVLLFCLALGPAACCARSSAAPPNTSGHPATSPPAEIHEAEVDDTATRSASSYYNWALSRCIGKAAKDERDRSDAFASAGGYLEQGELGIEIYEEMSKLVDLYLAKTYGSVVGSDLNTMKCIDLYSSEELDTVVKGFTVSQVRHPRMP